MQHAQSLSFNTSLGSTWILSTDYVANMMVNCDQTAGAQALDAEKQLQFVKIAPAEILIIDMTYPLNRRLVETYRISFRMRVQVRQPILSISKLVSKVIRLL